MISPFKKRVNETTRIRSLHFIPTVLKIAVNKNILSNFLWRRDLYCEILPYLSIANSVECPFMFLNAMFNQLGFFHYFYRDS